MADVTLWKDDVPVIHRTHVAAAELALGEVVLIGNLTGITCGIAERPIANGATGTLALGGIWKGINLSNAANGAKVYWDNSAKKFTTTSTNNAQFGFVSESGAGGANSTCYAIHHPWV